jgi:hypothetical protein
VSSLIAGGKPVAASAAVPTLRAMEMSTGMMCGSLPRTGLVNNNKSVTDGWEEE